MILTSCAISFFTNDDVVCCSVTRNPNGTIIHSWDIFFFYTTVCYLMSSIWDSFDFQTLKSLQLSELFSNDEKEQQLQCTVPDLKSIFRAPFFLLFLEIILIKIISRRPWTIQCYERGREFQDREGSCKLQLSSVNKLPRNAYLDRDFWLSRSLERQLDDHRPRVCQI